MSAEFRIREEIVHSLLVISDELDDIKNAFDDQNISTRLQKVLLSWKNIILKGFWDVEVFLTKCRIKFDKEIAFSDLLDLTFVS